MKSTWYLYILYIDILLHSILISSFLLCKRIKQLLKCQWVLDTNWLWESGPKSGYFIYPNSWNLHPNMHVEGGNETFVVGGKGDEVVFISHS